MFVGLCVLERRAHRAAFDAAQQHKRDTQEANATSERLKAAIASAEAARDALGAQVSALEARVSALRQAVSLVRSSAHAHWCRVFLGSCPTRARAVV